MKHIDHRILLILITLGGFGLRVIQLDLQPLWWDEGYSLFFATRDIATLLARTAVDIHPPLYYVLLSFWMAFAGQGEVAVRLLSVAIGVAAIPLLYLLASKLFARPRVALLAALLLALSPLHIYYSQEVRMYGLVTLLGLASVLFFVQLLDMPPGKPKTAIVALAYILATTAALYTQYYAVFILAFEVLFVVAHAFLTGTQTPDDWKSGSNPPPRAARVLREAQGLTHWLAAWAAILVLYAPWLIYAGGKLFTYVTAKKAIEQYTPLDPATFLAQHFTAFSTGHLSALVGLAWGSLVPLGFGVLGVALLWRRSNAAKTATPLLSHATAPWLVSLYLAVPLLFGYVVNLLYPFHPVHNERLLLLAMPAFLMMVAVGLNALVDRSKLLGTFALVMIAAISGASLYDFYTVPRYPNDDYRPLISQIQYLAQPGDTYLAIYPWQIGYLESYYTGAPLDVLETPSDSWINNPPQMQSALDARLAKDPRVWVPAWQSQGHILEDALDANLRPRTFSLLDTWFGTTRLELFDRADDPPQADHSIQFAIDGRTFIIDDWGVSSGTIAAGQDVLRLWLNNRNPMPSTLKASIRLVDSNNHVWAQDDRELSTGLQRIGFAIPAGTPPADYDLRAAVYSDQSAASETELLTHVHIVAPAQPDLAAIPHSTSIDLSVVRLVGYDAPPTIRPGEAEPITLYWQAPSPLAADYVVGLQAQDDRGNVYASAQTAPALGIYPTSRWQPNELIRDPQTITLRSDTPDGEYRLVASFTDAAKPPAQTASLARVIGTIKVSGRPHYYGAPAPSQTMNDRFGDVARLAGYDLNSDGRTARLILYWQALGSTTTSYKVFVHIVDSNGNIITQGDQVPGMGEFPTTSWVKGEYIVDLHEITIPSTSGILGEYAVRIGMYDPTTGDRFPSFDSSNKTLGDYIQLTTRINAAP